VRAQDCQCDVGQTGPDGEECEECVFGTFKDTLGSGSCECVPGSVRALAGSPCLACLPGKYKLDDRNCQDCPLHSFSSSAPGQGARSVLDCKCIAGMYSNTSGADNACVMCPPNSFSAYGSQAVEECYCLAGSYQLSPGDCPSCPANSYSQPDSRRLEDCICNAGYFLVLDGSSYVCEACPEDSDSSRGSESLYDCFCKAGFVGSDGGKQAQCASTIAHACTHTTLSLSPTTYPST
jgi:hypothetical protein